MTDSFRVRVATYNVHGCVGMDRQRSETRIAEVIADLKADIVGLQELDLSRKRSGDVDQAGQIAGQLGWHWHFHPAMQRGDEHYGHAILSRHPLTLRRAICLPGNAPFFCREERAALGMDVATEAGVIHVINTHFGLGRRERRLQAELLSRADWLDDHSRGAPLILLGDFNSLPGSRPYRTLSGRLRDVRETARAAHSLATFPTTLPLFAVDHIFVNAALRPVSVAVHRTALARIASDHFPLIAELSLSAATE